MSEGSKSDPSAAGRDKQRSAKARRPNSSGQPKGGDLGKALRSVYDTTLREDIPNDFLDLLGKLS